MQFGHNTDIQSAILYALLCAGQAASADHQPVIAVFDIEVKGVRFNADTLDRLNGYLIGRVIASGMFQVVPRADVKTRLTAQKLDSFKSCYDESCQIEIGKELAAHKSLSAQVIKVGSKCSVVLSVIDLKRAASERGASVDAACTEEAIAGALKDGVVQLAPPKVTTGAIEATRCEISFAKEGCPADPTRPASLEDAAEGADKDQARCLRRAIEYFDWCGSSVGVTARFYQGTKVLAEQRSERSTRCEIRFTDERCPSSPTDARKVWNDDAENAGSDQLRCLRRALDYFDWCGSSAPVIARYYEGQRLKREERAHRATRCEIRLSDELCPSTSDTRKLWNDNAENASSDEKRCMRRALEYYDWCGSTAPVVARYYQGTEVKREERAERKTRCEINLSAEGCPGNPSETRKHWIDDAEGASSNEPRCMRRALEYYDWCGSSAPVTARYFEGTTLKREQRGERATRCEIEFTEERCAANPSDPRTRWIDDWDHASSDQSRCMRRAHEYYDWCGSSAPVIARYFKGAKLEREERADPKTRCEISFSAERCPSSPTDPRTRWNDNAENAGSDQARCSRRALEYYDWCGSSEPVTARFYEGSSMKKEERAERKTRCEIRLPEERCPKFPTETRFVFNDDWNGASSTKDTCLRRASEWKLYCEIRGAVVARFLSGAKLIAENTAR